MRIFKKFAKWHLNPLATKKKKGKKLQKEDNEDFTDIGYNS